MLARDRVVTPDLLPPEISGVGGAAPSAQVRPTPPPRAPLPTLNGEEAPEPPLHDEDAALHVDVPGPTGDGGRLLAEMEHLEKSRIIEALAKCNGNQTRAAQMLGITRRVLIDRNRALQPPAPAVLTGASVRVGVVGVELALLLGRGRGGLAGAVDGAGAMAVGAVFGGGAAPCWATSATVQVTSASRTGTSASRRGTPARWP